MDKLPEELKPQVQIIQKRFFETPLGKIILGILSLGLIGALLYYLTSQGILKLSFFNKQASQNLTSQVVQTEIPQGATKISQIFVNQHLTSPYQTQVNLKKGIFTQKGETIELPSSFGYRWQGEEVSVNFSNQWDTDKQKPFNLNLTLSVPKTTTPISHSNVATMIAKYIQPPPNLAWDCGQANVAGIIQCHSMKTQADETRLGVSYTTNTKDNLEDLITICQTYPGSNTYTWETCLYK